MIRAIERAAQAMYKCTFYGHYTDDDVNRRVHEGLANAALTAGIDVEEIARAAHADDLAHGRAAVAWEDMDPDAIDWYMSNARAIRAAILGSDQ